MLSVEVKFLHAHLGSCFKAQMSCVPLTASHPIYGCYRVYNKNLLPRTHSALSWCQILEQLKIFTVTFKYWHS